MNTRKLIPVVVALIAVLATTLPTLAASGDTVANARDATAAFNDPAAAIAAGYDLLTDAAGIACIDQPGAGAMGIHYVKGALVQSGVIDTARPQAVVYELGENGRLQLVALEYVVLQAAWDAAHPATSANAVRRPEIHAHSGGQPLRPAGLLLTACLDLEAQSNGHLQHVEPARQLF